MIPALAAEAVVVECPAAVVVLAADRAGGKLISIHVTRERW